MKLIIAEKPSVARAIQDCLPATGYAVTNCFGHLLELAQPHAYDPKWEKWDPATLPIKIVNWKLVPKDGAKEQIKKIAALLKSATVVINAGDPDREGQLLVDEVLEHLGWRGPTQRLMLNATDPASVQKALAKIEDNAKYHPVRDAAACRQGADWLIGMNMSRAVTKMLSDGALVSIGRVQTPTLALIVRRQREIDAFRSETFYKLRATFKTDAGAAIDLMAEPQPRVLDIKIAQALAAAVKSKRTSLAVETAATVRRAPLPYDLSSFQKDAEAAFGWTAAQSLANLQASYEAKLTSYPRTDCRYLPSEQAGDALRIAKLVASAINPEPAAALMSLMSPSSCIYDSKKVEEHHGVIPTGMLPGPTTPDSVRKAWQLVCLQFLRSLLPDSKIDDSRVSAVVDIGGRTIKSVEFSANYERILNAGASWEALSRFGAREERGSGQASTNTAAGDRRRRSCDGDRMRACGSKDNPAQALHGGQPDRGHAQRGQICAGPKVEGGPQGNLRDWHRRDSGRDDRNTQAPQLHPGGQEGDSAHRTGLPSHRLDSSGNDRSWRDSSLGGCAGDDRQRQVRPRAFHERHRCRRRALARNDPCERSRWPSHYGRGTKAYFPIFGIRKAGKKCVFEARS